MDFKFCISHLRMQLKVRVDLQPHIHNFVIVNRKSFQFHLRRSYHSERILPAHFLDFEHFIDYDKER